MPRKLAAQVHIATSRLLSAGFMKSPPLWYNAVLAYPPIPLPPRDTAPREEVVTGKRPFDLPAKQFTERSLQESRRSLRTPKPRAQPIEYVEDKLRKQFFRDHPFEAYQPRTLVEGQRIEDEHPIQGQEWTRLRQHGRNPEPEDAVRFAACLYEHQNVPLSLAYARAVTQYRSLRAEHDVASTFALNEARHYGAHFAPSENERGARLASRALATWYKGGASNLRNQGGVQNRFTPVFHGRRGVPQVWKKGGAYTAKWIRGEVPNFWNLKATDPDMYGARKEAMKRVMPAAPVALPPDTLKEAVLSRGA